MRGLGLVLAAFAGLAWGQGSGSLAGTVVDAITAVPLAGVRLQLNYREAETTTDEQGRFRFVGMKPGGHFLLTELAGYASQPRGDAAIALSDGEKVEGMRVRLAPEAVVRGRVLDEYGRPIPARVAVTRQEPQVHVADVFSKTGEYEVRGLPAGAYRISVERTVGQPGPVLRTYDPGRHYAGSAENVQLSSGEHRLGLDIVSRPSPAFVAVRGRFLGSAPVGERLQLTRLNRKGGSMLLAPSGMLSESGRFVIGLAPGDYVLQVLGQPTGPGRMKILGKATISVAETEMSEEVQIRPVPLHTVRARARWVDGRRPPPPVSSFVLNPPELQGFLTWGKLQQDGSLAATEVSVGVYSALP